MNILALSEGSVTSIVTGVLVLLTLIVNRYFDQKKRREDREADRLERLESARLTAAGLKSVKDEGGLREERLSEKIEENTKLTKDVVARADDVKDHLNALTDMEQLKSMTTLAKKLGSTEAVFYNVELPPEDYVPFKLSEGSKVYWKSEYCDVGRQVRYLVEGPCSMGFHFHKSAEIVSGIRGRLYYETEGETVEINPGETYTTPPDTVHSARFEAPGEVVVHWPEQDTDVLEIGIWP